MDDFDDIDARLRGLFAAILARLRRLFGDRMPPGELLEAARRALDGIAFDRTTPSWATARTRTIAEVRRVERLGQVVRVVATIAQLTSPQIVRVDDRDQEVVSARLRDLARDEIWSLDVAGLIMCERLEARVREGTPCEFLVIPIALPDVLRGRVPHVVLDDTRRSFFVHVLDVRATTSALDVLGATDDERERVEDLRSSLATAGLAPTEHLYSTTVGLLGVVALDAFPLLALALRFTSLQALSYGAIEHTSARLHAIIPGPPGRGKKLIGRAAALQNPVCEEVSPAKASPAGLVGASYQTAEGWRSTPGAFARASGGVVVLQDAHGWRRSVAHQLAPILQELIEDGVVRDSVAGGATRVANTATIIDMNRGRHLTARGNHAQQPEAALLGIRPLLSRCDLLCELPDDVEQAWKVGRAMCDMIGRGRANVENGAAARGVRLLIAALRDRHRTVDLDPIRSELGNTFDRIYETNRDFIQEHPEAGDLPARLTITFARLISASARGHDRSVAQIDDLAEATRYVNEKLRFLRMYAVAPPTPSRRPDPADWVAAHAGETVRADDIRREYQDDTGAEISERQIRRHVQHAGGRQVGKGKYLLPGPSTAADSRES